MFRTSIISEFKNRETPFYYYDLALLNDSLNQVKGLAEKYDFEIHYAIKANSNERILAEILKAGFGADCVSGNEVKRAIECGFAPETVLFAGVGKTDKEIRYALEQNIKAFNCESIQEMEVINELAQEVSQTAEISLRINPNVDAKTHKYITTGLDENKFGINQTDLPTVIETLNGLSNIKLTGLHFHIGSQIMDMNVFKGLCLRVNEIESWFSDRGIEIEHLNLGGGLGVNYLEPDAEPIADFETYFAIFAEFLRRKTNQKVHFELGRSIVAQCGSLISRVVFIKNGLNTNFAVVDAGMTELMRPALYQSYHHINNLTSNGEPTSYDVVGPICESTDCFGKAIKLPETKRGDLIAIRSAGAYGEVMMSRYNLRDQNEAFYSE
ncbi:diaminopimelate decarboxylase [Aliikangiella coralliicola]|uniref:Diaminopimelate decarboxylase n=1 Tax=Aliikangiella coralliicola TaxID=2592383 RepID=A0A545TZW8_9GAMM|nr:diaminopimelate decarboxylase [Aliikangiella coralliicola]TQV82760.1 diaminopimelate decarboxylase [Aliikangiella coralliicola]